MVNRIIKKPLEEGSNTLPSILKINQGAHYLVNTINGDAIESGKVYKASALNGAIGNSYNEFTIDFLSDNVETMTDGVKRLYLSITNDIFITIKKDIEIERNFKIYKIDDMSYQAMTMNNYDFFIKLFKVTKEKELLNNAEPDDVYDDIGTSDNTQYSALRYEKVSTNSFVIIKAYTSKEAWILIDKSIIKDELSTAKFKLVIDFTYKFFKDETNKKLRFPNVNTFSNIQDLFNITEVSSPYYDRYYYTVASRTNMAFLNKQSEYISRSVAEIFTMSGTSKSFTLNTLPQITVKALRRDSEELDISKFKQKTIFADTSMAEVRPYLNSLSYEVYGYEEKNSSLGKRCFHEPELGQFKRFEVYPVLPGSVHYLFKITPVSGQKVKIKDVTDAAIRMLLKQKHIYLYNYFDLTYNMFVEGDDLYLDIYTYIPYEYEAAAPNFVTISNSTPAINLVDVFTGNNHSGDYRSRFDISRTYENEYALFQTLVESDYYLPYFGNDGYVETIINDIYALPENTQLVIPQVYSKDIDLLELKNGQVLNKYFDILSWDGGTGTFDQLQEDNMINASDFTDGFTNIGFRTGYDNFEAAEIISNYENENIVLCRNLSKLLPDANSIPLRVVGTMPENRINIDDCLFAYIDTNGGSEKYLNVTLKYVENGKTTYVYQSYKTYDSVGGKFIIPADQEYLKEIQIEKSNYRFYLMQ